MRHVTPVPKPADSMKSAKYWWAQNAASVPPPQELRTDASDQRVGQPFLLPAARRISSRQVRVARELEELRSSHQTPRGPYCRLAARVGHRQKQRPSIAARPLSTRQQAAKSELRKRSVTARCVMAVGITVGC